MRTWIVFLLALFSIEFYKNSACAAVDPDRIISVSGQCIKTVIPDRASIQIFAEAHDKDLKTALNHATQTYEKIRSGVKKAGLENLELTSTDYRLEEIIEWEKDRRVSKGFRARLGLMVESSSMDKMGDIIAMATREGAQETGALTLFLSPQAQQKEQFSCLETATRDARAKAERMAEGANTSITGIHSLSEQTNFPSYPPRPLSGGMHGMAMMGADAASGPSVEAGKQELRVIVNAQFSLK